MISDHDITDAMVALASCDNGGKWEEFNDPEIAQHYAVRAVAALGAVGLWWLHDRLREVKAERDRLLERERIREQERSS